MGNTCKPMAVSFQCMTKSTTKKKKKNNGVSCHALFQGIFPTQGSNPGFPSCRQILYSLSHHGFSGILEWVAYPFFKGSSLLMSRTGVSCTAVDSLPAEQPGKPKTVLRGKFIAVNTYINIYIKKGNLKINNLIFNFKVLEKKSKLNSKQAVGMK